MSDNRSFLANQKARNAIVGAENLLNDVSPAQGSSPSIKDLRAQKFLRTDFFKTLTAVRK